MAIIMATASFVTSLAVLLLVISKTDKNDNNKK